MSQLRPVRSLILKAGLLGAVGLAAVGAGPALAAGSTVTGTIVAQGTTAHASDLKIQLFSTLNDEYDPSTPVYVTVNGTTENFTITGVAAGTYYAYAYDETAGDNNAPAYFGGATASTAAILHVDGSNPGTTGTITLPVGATISGTISSAAGGVMAGGTVSVEPEPALFGSGVETASAAVQPNGTYTLSGLPAGSFIVQYVGNGTTINGYDVYSTAGPTNATSEGTPVSVALGATTTINMTVPVAGSITGTVTAAGSNTPLSDVEMLLFDSKGNGVTEVQTGADGQYTFSQISDGSYEVEAQPSGESVGIYSSTELNGLAFQFYSGSGTLSDATPVVVSGTGAMPNINLSLTAAGAIAGTVVSAHGGAPVALEPVHLLDSSGHVLDSTITANDGTYSFPNVPAGTFYVEFGGDSYLTLVAQFITAPAYSTEFYGGAPGLAGAKAVTITTGQTVTGINGALLPASSARIGLPTLSESKLGGLGKHRVTLSVKVAAGSGESADLSTVKLKLPSGLSWDSKTLAKDLSLGRAKYTRSLSGSTLALGFQPGERGFSLSVKAGGITDSKKLGSEAKAHKLASESIAVTVIDSQGVSTALKLTVKKPS